MIQLDKTDKQLSSQMINHAMSVKYYDHHEINNSLISLEKNENSIVEYPVSCYIGFRVSDYTQRPVLTFFNRPILQLNSLTSLTLYDNNLNELPEAIASLPLQCLILKSNNLGTSNWKWLKGKRIQDCLEVLDLSKNNILELPAELGYFELLFELRVNDNYLETLHPLTNMLSLYIFDATNNRLTHLSGNFVHNLIPFGKMRLEHNLFCERDPAVYIGSSVPSLKALAAGVIINKKVSFTSDNIPLSLVNYLNAPKYCSSCERFYLETYRRDLVNVSCSLLRELMFSELYVEWDKLPLEYSWCSINCYLIDMISAIE